MNLERLRTWTAALRSGNYGQVSGVLAKQEGPDQPWNYCCLGVACEVAGIVSITTPTNTDSYDNPIEWEKAYGEGQVTELPPHSLHAWLGVVVDDDDLDHTGDVPLDWPEEYESLDQQDRTLAGNPKYLASGTMTCANMNDDLGLTFPQIADMLDYFGVRGE